MPDLDHCRIVTSELSFVTLTKNPYSWLLSLHRKPYHIKGDRSPVLEDFLSRPWITVGRDNAGKRLKNSIELWNQKNRSYLQLDERRSLKLKSEDLFTDPAEVVSDISRRFSIPRKVDAFVNFEASTKDISKNGDYYRDYYLNERWREELSPEDIAMINDAVDQELMCHFGYQVLP